MKMGPDPWTDPRSQRVVQVARTPESGQTDTSGFLPSTLEARNCLSLHPIQPKWLITGVVTNLSEKPVLCIELMPDTEAVVVKA